VKTLQLLPPLTKPMKENPTLIGRYFAFFEGLMCSHFISELRAFAGPLIPWDFVSPRT